MFIITNLLFINCSTYLISLLLQIHTKCTANYKFNRVEHTNTQLPINIFPRTKIPHQLIHFFLFVCIGLRFLFVLHILSYRGQREFTILILLWIQCILASITRRESVMPSCACPGFPGILLCGFHCIMSLCTLVTSGSPCACPCWYMIQHMLSVAAYAALCFVLNPCCHNLKMINYHLTQIWVYHKEAPVLQIYISIVICIISMILGKRCIKHHFTENTKHPSKHLWCCHSQSVTKHISSPCWRIILIRGLQIPLLKWKWGICV